MSQHVACQLDELGSLPLAVTVAGQALALVRVGEQVYAIADQCSHGAAPLSEGEVDQQECSLECYLHGARFSLRTGRPLNLPATQPVPVYPTTLEDGQVLVDLDNPIDPTTTEN